EVSATREAALFARLNGAGSAANEEKGESDRNEVFEKCNEGVLNLQCRDQASSNVVTGECSNDSAGGAKHRPKSQSLITANPINARPTKSARNNTGDQRYRRSSFWRRRLQVDE